MGSQPSRRAWRLGVGSQPSRGGYPTHLLGRKLPDAGRRPHVRRPDARHGIARALRGGRRVGARATRRLRRRARGAGASGVALILEHEGVIGRRARAGHARAVQDALGLGAKMGRVASADAIASVCRDGVARRLACGLPSDEQLSAGAETGWLCERIAGTRRRAPCRVLPCSVS